MSANPKFTVNSVWRTRDGLKARIICVDAMEPSPIVALIPSHPEVGSEYAVSLTGDGALCSFLPDNFDLIEPWKDPEPPKPRMRAWISSRQCRFELHEESEIETGMLRFAFKRPGDEWIRAKWLDEPEGSGE